jgi:WD40 repeat protein
MSLSSDGKYLMAIDDYALMIWDISTKKQILRTKVNNLDYADRFYTAEFSADGQQILIGLKVSEDSIYSMNSRAHSGRIFAYNFTEIVESYYA